jgi:hypothetical protein
MYGENYFRRYTSFGRVFSSFLKQTRMNSNSACYRKAPTASGGRHVLIKRILMLTLTTLAAVAPLSCSYRYTKAFHLKNKFPTRRTDFWLVDNLPERFGPWVVQVYIWSVKDSKDREKIAANMYSCGLVFGLPEDTIALQTVVAQPNKLFANDTSVNVIAVDSITLDLEPSRGQKILPTDAGRRYRNFHCGTVHIPESVDSLTLRFTARLENPDGVEIMQKNFEARFYRWEYRWNAWLPLE